MATLSIADRTVLEGTTPRVTGTLYDDAGEIIPGSTLDTLALTLEDAHTKRILGGRENQDILNENGVTIEETGVLTWLMDAADNAIITDRSQGLKEKHYATFRWTWGDDRHGAAVVEILVEALDH